MHKYLQYFISHRRLNVDFHLRARQNVDVDDISERLELRFGLRFAGVFDVSIQLPVNNKGGYTQGGAGRRGGWEKAAVSMFTPLAGNRFLRHDLDLSRQIYIFPIL